METLIETFTALDNIRVILLCVAASALMFFIAAKVHLIRRSAWSDAQPVMLKVVEIHADEQIRDDHTIYRSEYEIVTGPHAGRRRRSEVTSSPAIHTAGETASGLFNPVTGEIETYKALKKIVLLERMLLGLSVAVLLFGLAYTAT